MDTRALEERAGLPELGERQCTRSPVSPSTLNAACTRVELSRRALAAAIEFSPDSSARVMVVERQSTYRMVDLDANPALDPLTRRRHLPSDPKFWNASPNLEAGSARVAGSVTKQFIRILLARRRCRRLGADRLRRQPCPAREEGQRDRPPALHDRRGGLRECVSHAAFGPSMLVVESNPGRSSSAPARRQVRTARVPGDDVRVAPTAPLTKVPTGVLIAWVCLAPRES